MVTLLTIRWAGLMAQTEHRTPFTGSWRLNLSKSKYNLAPPPKSARLTLKPDGSLTVDAVEADGKPFQWSAPWSDGREVPIEGIDNGTMVATYGRDSFDHQIKIKGKVVAMAHGILSANGRVLTMIVRKPGSTVHNIEISDRE